MPSIELLAVNCRNRIYLPEYSSFTWCTEVGTPKGHRGSFDAYLKKLTGVFVHLGDRDLIRGKDKYWAASTLIDLDALDEQRAQHDRALVIVFKKRVIPEIIDLVQRLSEASPDKKLIFLTDYQLADNEGQEFPVEQTRMEEFISDLTNHYLKFNVLYEVSGNPSKFNG